MQSLAWGTQPLPALFQSVHGPLAHWSALQPEAVALSDGQQQLQFAPLHAQVQRQAQALREQRAPATVLLDGRGTGLARIVDFLAVIASGRCAAVADPDWPAGVQARIAAQFAQLPAADMPEPGPQTPFYVGFTSGSSGTPKGFRRHHRSWVESFRVSVEDLGGACTGRVYAPGRLGACRIRCFCLPRCGGCGAARAWRFRSSFPLPGRWPGCKAARSPCWLPCPASCN